jgi:pimeloyl-ACP methyl ester carboxylesterase
MGGSTTTPDGSVPRRGPRARPRRRVLAAFLAVLLLAVFGYFGYVGYEGSRLLVYGDAVKHGCQTPATLGWAYEAVNYDIADDARLQASNRDWTRDCPDRGAGTAGTQVVSSDGIRIAGWYVPSAAGDPPTAPTVVLVHGWHVSKTDMLRYAVMLHDRFNLAFVDLRDSGRSSGDQHTFGALEARDLRAFLDWLTRTKHPSKIGVLGDSGGAAAAAMLVRTDGRIAALVLESPFSRFATLLEQVTWTPPTYPSVWAVELGFWLRTGMWPGGWDPIDAIPDLGSRPLAISYGTADQKDLPEKNAILLYKSALAAGVPVETHPCAGAPHGQAVDTCPIEYRAWVVPFFERALTGG